MINMKDHDSALSQSIAIHGDQMKKIICMEELAELTQAVSKNIRGKDNNDNLVEEMADVMICLEMLKLMCNVKDEDLQKWIDFKIARQIKRDNGEVKK